MHSHALPKTVTTVTAAILLSAPFAFGQSAHDGHAMPLDQVHFSTGKRIPCLSSAPETGDPNTGPSTEVLKASKGCVVPWHYHTAEEQLIVAAGSLVTEMEGVPPATLGPGGFAVMRGLQKHQFTCRSDDACIVFVSFNQKYDIVWVDKTATANKP